ncbi:DUF4175 family protein [Sunxiuqinia dokdonensis]|uniref:ATPase n=1 Tax=Sunxiuqinia dokdonensis TaxID=1409788 RepID=A0A0L8V3R9_9BACT|nr:DUF4175 family protein [Sunxiuqinia dokdonensis]KOH43064.1 hypothetical protein NC99_41230 [Sunxiuqinia dokdonensis]
MTESYKHLVDKLNAYIRKYNFYQFMKGIILFITLIISYVIVVSTIEYFSFLSSTVRQFLFFSSALSFAAVSVFYFFIPLFRLLGLLKTMDFETAADLITKNFSEIDDRLLNIIELAKLEKESSDSLVWASVNQKINQIKLFDFSKAVSFRKLRRSVLLLAALGLFGVVLSMVFPGVFTEASQRLLAYERTFLKPAPFNFVVINDSLQVKRGDRLSLTVMCEGRQVPEILYVNIGGSNYLMNKKDDLFLHELEHVNNNFTVYFTDLTHQSARYKVEVLAAPAILDYTVEIVPPAYTGYETRKESMLGDLEVPYGSEISWLFQAIDTDSLIFKLDGGRVSAEEVNKEYRVSTVARSNVNYSISIKNEDFDYDDLLSFSIEVIPDLYPEIKVVQLRDSTEFTRFFFKGSINDDYGFHRLAYHLVINQNDSSIVLPVAENLSQQDFYFTYDFGDLAGVVDQVDYYFSVRDNDYFHQYKESVSETFQFKFPSKEELDELDDQNFQSLEELMAESMELSDEIQRAIEDLKFKSLSENSSGWEKQQMVSEILNKKNRLEEILKKVQQKNSEMNNLRNSFSEENAELIKKQQEVEELLNDVFDEELKKLFEEFNELAKDFDQSKFNELSNRSEMSMDDLSKQLERNLQMLKRMKVEQKVENVIDGLADLADKEKLNARELDENRIFEETREKERENRRDFESIKDDLKDALKLNESLDKPMNLHPLDSEFEKINSNYDEIGEMLDNRRKKKSVEEIENNAKSFENASFSLDQMLAMNQQKESMENIRDLQQILDNLVYLSLRQEMLHDQVRAMTESDPRLTEVRKNQDRLIKQSGVVKDSLFAVAKRTPEIGNVVTKELMKLEFSMDRALSELVESRFGTAVSHQQMAMTAANNMALFLNEALNNLQKQMASSMPGDQQCDKPGSGQGNNMNMLKDAQQGIKEQLQQMIEQMKSGESGGMSEQIGKTLAQQEMMQQMIRQLMMDSDVGSSAKEQLKQINQLLEQNNVDLANKQITATMISRQNLILNKLLKAEKAEMERDVEDERESKTVDENFYSNPIEFFEYKQQEKELQDVIERNAYQLRIFYDRKYREYINNLRKEN